MMILVGFCSIDETPKSWPPVINQSSFREPKAYLNLDVIVSHFHEKLHYANDIIISSTY